ncbi:MAG: 16S rRNA (cytosine(1402)-N(4))-methyltransferase RsmH [Candidatus Margulisiibacteriota bacterium]
MSNKYKHIPVLLKEAIDFLNAKNGKIFVDCTLGGGGHTEEIKIRNPKSEIFGIDLDQEAIEAAKPKLAKYENMEYFKGNFKNIKQIVKKPVDGILFDLGISSFQIEEARRGFSLQKDGPLDMRMDPSQTLTAKDILNRFNQDKLQRIFREFGEERFAHRIAKAIVRKRKVDEINTTLELRKIVEEAIPTWRKRESVSRIFQALRIALNQELDNLKTALSDAIDLLKPGGRIVVISYHSLEDRIVKHTFKQASQAGKLNLLTKKPLRPKESEISSNPRARSAKLRAAEKI